MILVTGATGKVGHHLVAGLVAEGAPVRALTRSPGTARLPAGAQVTGWDPGRPETIGAAIGRSLRFEELPAEAFRQAAAHYMPAAAARDLLRYLAEYVGRTAEMSPDIEAITGRPATTFKDWAAEHVASFTASPERRA